MLLGKRCYFHNRGTQGTYVPCQNVSLEKVYGTCLTEPAYDAADGDWRVLVLIDGRTLPRTFDAELICFSEFMQDLPTNMQT